MCMEKQTGQAYVIWKSEKGTIWHSTCSITILEIAILDTYGTGLQIKWIQPMSVKQDKKW